MQNWKCDKKGFRKTIIIIKRWKRTIPCENLYHYCVNTRDKAANLICMCKTKTLKWKQNWATATEVGIHELRITTRNFHVITKFVELIKVLIDSV